mmetsp:Transcript_3868/g.5592  ORF Transcript_3868/g.5592 Transcript_3868/m.5592 type:complete len:81 (+) Transcript_3868:1173-1415(+)
MIRKDKWNAASVTLDRGEGVSGMKLNFFYLQRVGKKLILIILISLDGHPACPIYQLLNYLSQKDLRLYPLKLKELRLCHQ